MFDAQDQHAPVLQFPCRLDRSSKQSALRCNFNPQIHDECKTHCLRLIPLLGSGQRVLSCVHVLRMTFAKRALRNKQLDAAVINGDALRKEARSMRKPSPGHAGRAIERVLELSADAQITRRQTPKNSPTFHSLTGAIAAYGKALALLTALQQREEFYRIISQSELSEHAVTVS